MDEMGSLIDEADEELRKSHFQRALELLRTPIKKYGKKMGFEQHIKALELMLMAYGRLGQTKNAISCAKRMVFLAPVGTVEEARMLCTLATEQYAAGDSPGAATCIANARKIMLALGAVEYSVQVRALIIDASIMYDEGHYATALEKSQEAYELWLMRNKNDSKYAQSVLLGLAGCNLRMNKWNEAIAIYKIAEQLTLRYEADRVATLIWAGNLYEELKQYEESLPRYREALAMRARFHGEQDMRTRASKQMVDRVRALMARPDRAAIVVPHAYRMCGGCKTVRENMEHCACLRAWYCGPECQLLGWATHRAQCVVCAYCEQELTGKQQLVCSRCKSSKYCSKECSAADWSEHRKSCK